MKIKNEANYANNYFIQLPESQVVWICFSVL